MSNAIRLVSITRKQIDAYRTQCLETLQHALRDVAPPASGTVPAIVNTLQALECLRGLDDPPDVEEFAFAEVDARQLWGEAVEMGLTTPPGKIVATGIAQPMPEHPQIIGTIPAGATVTPELLRDMVNDSVAIQPKPRSRKGKE